MNFNKNEIALAGDITAAKKSLQLRLELIEQMELEHREDMQCLQSRIEELVNSFLKEDEEYWTKTSPLLCRVITELRSDYYSDEEISDIEDSGEDDMVNDENDTSIILDNTLSNDKNARDIKVEGDDQKSEELNTKKRLQAMEVQQMAEVKIQREADFDSDAEEGNLVIHEEDEDEVKDDNDQESYVNEGCCNDEDSDEYNDTRSDRLQYPQYFVTTLEPAYVVLGSNGTRVDAYAFDRIVWSTTAAATRALLSLVFTDDILATHTLTGKPSPAFHGRERPSKMQLDILKTADIVQCVVAKVRGANERQVRSSITSKCADTAKKFKRRDSKSSNEY